MTIVDISDPYGLQFVSNMKPSPELYPPHVPGRFYYVSVKDSIVYLSGVYGVAVIDARNQLQPVQIGRLYFADTLSGGVIDDLNEFGMTVAYDHYLFASFIVGPGENPEKYDAGIYQYDISDPLHSELVKKYPSGGYLHLLAMQDSVLIAAVDWLIRAYVFVAGDTLVAKDSITDQIYHSVPQDISICGNHLFVAGSGGQNRGGISNFNIADLDSIYRVEDFTAPTHFNCVAFVDSIGIAGYFHWDLLLMRLRANGRLDSTGLVSTKGNVGVVEVYDERLYVSDSKKGLLVYNIVDNTNPEYETTFTNDAGGTKVADGFLFLNNSRGVLMAYDISTMPNPVLLDSVPGDRSYSFYFWDDLLFAGSEYGAKVYDFSTRHLRLVDSSSQVEGTMIMVHDSLLFWLGGVAKLNSDTSMTFLSQIGGFGMSGFDVTDSFYFASRGYFGLHVFNVADPARPTYVARWDTFTYANPPGDGLDVTLIGTNAFLLDGDWGITVLDVRNPTQPRCVKRIQTPAVARSMTYDDKYIYVADAWGVEIFRYDSGTDTNDSEPTLPKQFTLHQNYPNPFSSRTAIKYDLPRPGNVELSIYNFLGQHVRTLFKGYKGLGTHYQDWDGTSNSGEEVGTGIYFYQARLSAFSETKKMILLK